MAYLRINALRRAESSKRTRRTPRMDRESSERPSYGHDRPKRPEPREDFPRFQLGSESIKDPDAESPPDPFNRGAARRPWNAGRPLFDPERTLEDTLVAASDASTTSVRGTISVSYRPRPTKTR